VYWRNLGGDPISESGLNGTVNHEYIFFNGNRAARRDISGNAVRYYFADHLGSTDVVTNPSGTITKESDYYPYGGEIPISGSDINNYKFTGKERDSESGLDQFGARYYGSTMGRFTSPDPKLITARHFGFPQKWNKYVYVQNNPLARFDPDGKDDYVVFRTATDPKTGKEILAGTHSKEWSAAEKAITSQKDAKGTSNTFHMLEGEKATADEYNKAKNTPDTHVVFVGHSLESESGRAQGIELSNGASYGKEGSQYFTPGAGPDAAPNLVNTLGVGDPLSASSVALFGCNTYGLSSQYPGTDFTGVQSGPDGTMIETLDLMAAGWVAAGGGQSGLDNANTAVEKSPHPVDTGTNAEGDRE
jgi:RHS repeat-associated protein